MKQIIFDGLCPNEYIGVSLDDDFKIKEIEVENSDRVFKYYTLNEIRNFDYREYIKEQIYLYQKKEVQEKKWI